MEEEQSERTQEKRERKKGRAREERKSSGTKKRVLAGKADRQKNRPLALVLSRWCPAATGMCCAPAERGERGGDLLSVEAACGEERRGGWGEGKEREREGERKAVDHAVARTMERALRKIRLFFLFVFCCLCEARSVPADTRVPQGKGNTERERARERERERKALFMETLNS